MRIVNSRLKSASWRASPAEGGHSACRQLLRCWRRGRRPDLVRHRAWEHCLRSCTCTPKTNILAHLYRSERRRAPCERRPDTQSGKRQNALKHGGNALKTHLLRRSSPSQAGSRSPPRSPALAPIPAGPRPAPTNDSCICCCWPSPSPQPYPTEQLYRPIARGRRLVYRSARRSSRILGSNSGSALLPPARSPPGLILRLPRRPPTKFISF